MKAYAWLVVLFAVLGGGTRSATRTSAFPSPRTRCCGTDLEFLVNNFPLAQALPKCFRQRRVLQGAMVVSRPVDSQWALVWFVIFAVTAFLVARHKRSVFR